ncbi:hypothetical protein, partial [Bacillus mycoides]|uniref:hypothetical protein n=1 Tax=Bacillus mycoides TaxID=1405 RepID=UPI001C92CEFF
IHFTFSGKMVKVFGEGYVGAKRIGMGRGSMVGKTGRGGSGGSSVLGIKISKRMGIRGEKMKKDNKNGLIGNRRLYITE